MSGEESKVGKKRDMNWVAVLWYIHLHVLGLYGLLILAAGAKWMTIFFAIFVTVVGCMGTTLGAHRLWAHRTYTGTWHIRLFLMLAHTLSGVGPIYDWVLAHRIHHKYFGTDRDPYNHKKGLLYSHLMSNLVMQHPEHEEIVKNIDMRDMDQDGFVWIQKKLYWPLFIIFGLLLPINAPAEYWNETLVTSIFLLGFVRFAITVNIAWLVNSAVLVWGLREGAKFPPDDLCVFFLRRTFWPRYHYMLPWDWKSGEFGTYNYGWNTFFLKMWYEMGLVSGLQTASNEDIRDTLYDIATKRATTQDGIYQLKIKSEEHAKKVSLQYPH